MRTLSDILDPDILLNVPLLSLTVEKKIAVNE